MFEFCGKQSFWSKCIVTSVEQILVTWEQSVKVLLGERSCVRQLDNSTRQGHEASDPEYLGVITEILVGQKDGFMEGLRLDGFIHTEWMTHNWRERHTYIYRLEELA